MDNKTSQAYTEILRDELKTAMGCTEPIAIAYCAAYAKKLLGCMPETCDVHCSGNIIKNSKAVTVPHTDGMKGIEAAALAGMVGGDAEKQLEVLSTVGEEDLVLVRDLLKSGLVHVHVLDSTHMLHIITELRAGEKSVSVEIIDGHTNLGDVKCNGRTLHTRQELKVSRSHLRYDLLNIRDILDYADTVDIKDVSELLDGQVQKNSSIAREGLTHDWGASVGRTLMCCENGGMWTRAKAMAAAGSDARMNGCAMPVVINSGSGNQGLTVSLPVAVYAQDKGVGREKLLRALCVSNLVAIRQKREIGKLSAFCGAVCAAIGAVTGIAYLEGASYQVISQTIINSIVSIGGMMCDGAKSSCAGKIASALDCAFLGYELARKGHGYRDGEGLVKDNVEKTIESVGSVARNGMRSTDQEILRIMV